MQVDGYLITVHANSTENEETPGLSKFVGRDPCPFRPYFLSYNLKDIAIRCSQSIYRSICAFLY
jgi:hypothetical protein